MCVSLSRSWPTVTRVLGHLLVRKALLGVKSLCFSFMQKSEDQVIKSGSMTASLQCSSTRTDV